jgi:ribosomal-protein-alanine N-acetyltransferase
MTHDNPAVVREMQVDDLDRIVEIEAETYSFPWTSGIFSDCLRVGYCCRVVEAGATIAGYGIMSVGTGDAHILNLCIADGFRRRGLGRMMLQELLEQVACDGESQVFLEVRPSNENAMRLYLSSGFRRIGIRKAYYRAHSGREDAVVLALRVADRQSF